LDLRNNNITDVQSIGEGLKTNNTLKELDLSFNDITYDGGIQSIIDGLKSNNTLQYLDLSDNNLLSVKRNWQGKSLVSRVRLIRSVEQARLRLIHILYLDCEVKGMYINT
jgi:hypothetical protein